MNANDRSPTRPCRVMPLFHLLVMSGWALLVVCSCAGSGSDTDRPPIPANVILFIGDGMGAQQRLAAQWASVGAEGRLAMDDMDTAGRVRTASADQTVTDSAAAATAMATGVKTNNGMIGMDPQQNVLQTILEAARSRGKQVGLVTTVPITHATPAAFAAHVADRNAMTVIAAQMLSTGVDVLLGGGEDQFLPVSATGCYPHPGERTDGRDLTDEAVAGGYRYVCDAGTLAVLDPAATPRLLGLFADEGLPVPFVPDLAEMTQAAIEILSHSSEGFFLMVEAGQIDWAAHDNDAEGVIRNTLGLDAAVGVAQAFVLTHPATLVIVTADHETGGMTVSTASSGAVDEDGPFSQPDGTLFYVNWSTTGHTGQAVPLTASGPLADLFSGDLENTAIYDGMMRFVE